MLMQGWGWMGRGSLVPRGRLSPRSPARCSALLGLTCRWPGKKSIQTPLLGWGHLSGAGEDVAAVGAPQKSCQHPCLRAEGMAEPLSLDYGDHGDHPRSPQVLHPQNGETEGSAGLGWGWRGLSPAATSPRCVSASRLILPVCRQLPIPAPVLGVVYSPRLPLVTPFLQPLSLLQNSFGGIA